MFGKKCEKKGHPCIAFMLGALTVLGVSYIKNCGMNMINSKMQSFSSMFKKGESAMQNAMASMTEQDYACQNSSSC